MRRYGTASVTTSGSSLTHGYTVGADSHSRAVSGSPSPTATCTSGKSEKTIGAPLPSVTVYQTARKPNQIAQKTARNTNEGWNQRRRITMPPP